MFVNEILLSLKHIDQHLELLQFHRIIYHLHVDHLQHPLIYTLKHIIQYPEHPIHQHRHLLLLLNIQLLLRYHHHTLDQPTHQRKATSQHRPVHITVVQKCLRTKKYIHLLDQVHQVWILYLLALLPHVSLETKISALRKKQMMPLLNVFVKSCLYCTSGVITIPPPFDHITNYLLLSLLHQLDLEPQSLLLQHTLVQNNSPIHLILLLLKYSPPNKLLFPKFAIIRYHLYRILKKRIIDTIRIPSFQIRLDLLYPLLKVSSRLQLKIQLSAEPYLPYLLIFLGVVLRRE